MNFLQNLKYTNEHEWIRVETFFLSQEENKWQNQREKQFHRL